MNRLKELRKEKKLTQTELADEIGVTKLSISNWENEKHDIKSDKAQQLADYFGVSVGYLLGYESNEQFIQKAKQLQNNRNKLYNAFEPISGSYKKQSETYFLYEEVENIVSLSRIIDKSLYDMNMFSYYYPKSMIDEKTYSKIDEMYRCLEDLSQSIGTYTEIIKKNFTDDSPKDKES